MINMNTSASPIKNEVIRYMSSNGVLLIYTRRLKKDDKKSLFDVQSRLRRRSFLHRCVVVQYHPDMYFSNSLSKGGYFINDFRDTYKK